MTYELYGCRIESNGPLPGVRTIAVSDIELSLHFGTLPPTSSSNATLIHQGQHIEVRRNDLGYHFIYGDGTEFLVSPSGDHVTASTPSDASHEDTCTYFVGPVMGFVLRLRNIVCLHASTVVLNEKAIAFCGPPGAGKSTTAGALALRGYPVLAEDVAALDDRGDTFFVQPGYPRVNLWPESAAALHGSPERLNRITPNWGKHYMALDTGESPFQPHPLPLSAIYILGDRREGPDPELHPLASVEALIALASNTYTPYLLDPAMRAREFDVLTRLVKLIPVRRIHAPSDFCHLDRFCQAILQDCESLS